MNADLHWKPRREGQERGSEAPVGREGLKEIKRGGERTELKEERKSEPNIHNQEGEEDQY